MKQNYIENGHIWTSLKRRKRSSEFRTNSQTTIQHFERVKHAVHVIMLLGYHNMHIGRCKNVHLKFNKELEGKMIYFQSRIVFLPSAERNISNKINKPSAMMVTQVNQSQ